ncbi:MAG: glycine--tRNA ligase subunit beta, partial [Propionibacterium sp.]|nr:glycine--tRNA ligase subunit beta [Propionibacterium sp.]
SLEALGIDLDAHDVRFVEDNWQQPAIGAWGLGWEVWLDGMEITQFTYFQQVGGQNLDPIPVELTYGMERILMALQGKTHFKDIVYAIASDGREITYGEAYGQQEYEMSRYYLDDADVDANRALYETFSAEAARMVEARLPMPAHTYILKSSHAFNVLDARGAISTNQRAKAFATMRRLMRDTAALWVERREELGFPLNRAPKPVEAPPADDGAVPTTPQTLAFEIGVEELPPHVLPQTVEAVRAALTEKLAATRLEHGAIAVDGTPRRIVATVADVAPSEPDATQLRKGPKWAAAFDADGNPTKALEGFMRGQKVTREQIVQGDFAGNDHAAVEIHVEGRHVRDVAAGIIAEIVEGLRAEKNMRWNDANLSFSRAIRWLVALWGTALVPVEVSGLHAGRVTHLQRLTRGTAETKARVSGTPVGFQTITEADGLLPTLERGGIMLSTEARRASVVEQATKLAEEAGGVIDLDANADLLDEITNLVEEPVGVLGTFDERYLDLPAKILVSVMAQHQRYLPVRAADGSLMPYFVTMANGPCDGPLVAAGNESVLRARYEDALFFWNQDLEVESVDEFVPGLEQLTFEDRLGSVGQRARRIADVAQKLADIIRLDDRTTLRRAGELAKFDLATSLVVEMSSLAGFVAREYAKLGGETNDVAEALYEMEQPHTSADAVPTKIDGALLALGDRFDLLAAMFALGAKPTGSSDPFGLRRAALGVVRILREVPGVESITVRQGLEAAVERIAEQGVEVAEDAVDAAEQFTIGRFAQLLRDEGRSAEHVNAILPAAGSPGRAARLLHEIVTAGESLRPLVETLVRIERILPDDAPATYDAALLTEPAEV